MTEPSVLITPWLGGWLAAALLLATALLVVISALIERSSPIRLRHWSEEAGGRLHALYEAPGRFEAFRFLLSSAGRLLPAVAMGGLYLALRQLGWLRAASTAILVVVALVVVVEWLARTLVERHAEAALTRLTIPLRLIALALAPAIWLLGRWAPDASNGTADEEPEDEVSDNEIRAFIDVGRREGILEPEEELLVRSVVDFGDTQVRSVMTPRVEVIAAPVDLPLEELAARFFESKHARLPLFRESIDHIVGILHIRDLFEAIHGGPVFGAEGAGADTLVNPALFVPETKALRDLLAELQSLHQQMAIVVDEYGGVAGLVTVEDLVEEIVGEIADEHEAEELGVEVLTGGGWRVAGRTELPELAEWTGVTLDELPYETVSGLICGELGYVPPVGERFAWPPLAFHIESADGRRVTSVTVEREDGDAGGDVATGGDGGTRAAPGGASLP